ncbi:hypothetical protein G6L28_19075 [Agrobacterium larrymoorei]|nr:hypothetical protein [Agrobacterium larrymoorei]
MKLHQFCRDLCVDRGEPLPGTGAAAKRYALLHWPRRYWRVPRTNSLEMPEVLSKAIVEANEAAIHVALVDGDDIAFSFDGKTRHVAAPERAAEYLSAIARGESFDGDADDRITILCCTDSKQDPCCARYGFATWKTLREQADPSRFRVLQSTHLGGCRFAATLLVLPNRQRYGRLEPQQVSDFLQCLSKGRPYLPAYRGNPLLAPVAQVAEQAAMDFAADLGLVSQVSLQESPVSKRDTGEAEFLARTASLELCVRLRQTSFDVNTRCNTIAEGSGTETIRWQVVAVDRVSD